MSRFLKDTRGRVTLLGLAAGMLLAVTMVGAFVAGQPGGEVPLAYAAWNPPGSSLDVIHLAWDGQAHEYVINVEPNTGEDWAITATWLGPGPSHQEVAYADVDWSTDHFAISGVAATAGIPHIELCTDEGTCGTQQDPHGFRYKLVVSLVDPILVGGKTYNLSQVRYDASNIDDGVTLIGSPCADDTAVSPTASSFYQTDYYPFWQGSVDCDVTAEDLTITYQ